MTPFSFPGTYRDRRGEEPIVWRVIESRIATPPGHGPRFEVHTTIPGVPCWGFDFDGLEPVDADDPKRVEVSMSDKTGELTDCVLTGDLPCIVESEGTQVAAAVTFSLDLSVSAQTAYKNLSLSVAVDGRDISVVDDWFEDGTRRLEAQLPEPHQLRCCVTCLYSDYSPGGHGLSGMACHRDAKEQYLAVRSKTDYWSIPVTEDLLETYVCSEYQRRVPGTGYRG